MRLEHRGEREEVGLGSQASRVSPNRVGLSKKLQSYSAFNGKPLKKFQEENDIG